MSDVRLILVVLALVAALLAALVLALALARQRELAHSQVACVGGAHAPRSALAPRSAWVTLVMRGDAYVPGALALAASLRASGTAAATVCMVTDDVSAGARRLLGRAFDRAVVVDKLTYLACPMRTDKQNAMYGSWIADSFTKWRCLDFTEYARVIFLDADVVLLGNCDHLFEVPAPAGIFSSPWARPYAAGAGLPNPYLQSSIRRIKGDKPVELAHGAAVPDAAVARGLQESFVAFGTTLLLAPAPGLLAAFCAYCARAVDARGCVGSSACFSGADEQSIVGFFLELAAASSRKNVNASACANSSASASASAWHHISQRFGDIPWHPRWQTKNSAWPTDSHILHFHGKTKVWETSPEEWPDVAPWWRFAAAAVAADPQAAGVFDPEILMIQN